MLKINFEEFDRIYLGQISYKYKPQSIHKFFCHFYPKYKLENGNWKKIIYEEEQDFLSNHNDFLFTDRDKSGVLNKNELKNNSRIINKKYYIILIKKEILEVKTGNCGEKEVWINIETLNRNKYIRYLSEFDLFPLINIEDFQETDVCLKTETILEDWCFRFYLDYIFLYNKTEEKYYGKYKIITKNNQPLLSLSPEQAYGIINIYESKDLSDNILDIEDENYVFFWEKENMQCKKKDILTEENIYSTFLHFFTHGNLETITNSIYLLKEIGKLFIENVPKEFAEQRIEIVNKCIDDFCVYSKILEESKDKMIKRVFDYILTCPEDKQNKYIDLCKQTLQKIENKKELD